MVGRTVVQVPRVVTTEFLDRVTARYAQRLLNQRLLNIARTETIAAANEGQRQLWQQAIDRGDLTGRERRAWITTPDDRLAVVGPRTAVLTRNGWRPISSIQVGDYVLTHLERFCRVSRAEGKWYYGPTVMIYLVTRYEGCGRDVKRYQTRCPREGEYCATALRLAPELCVRDSTTDDARPRPGSS